MAPVSFEVAVSAVVPLVVALLNLLVAAYALTFGLRQAKGVPARVRSTVAFAGGPAGVGLWALAWFISVFDPEALPTLRFMAWIAVLVGVIGLLLDALFEVSRRTAGIVLGVTVGLAGGLLAVVELFVTLPLGTSYWGLVGRLLALAGLGGIAAVRFTQRTGPEARSARRGLAALVLTGVGYASLALAAFVQDGVGVDVLLFVVLSLELLALIAILERRVQVEVLLSRAVTYAFLAVVVAAVAAWVFRRLGYDVDLVTVSVTVAIALMASALFMGVSDPLTRKVEQALFPEHARMQRALEASQSELSALRRRLERVEKLAIAGELAASVAHEIKNPLAPVRGYAQMLAGRLDGVPDDQRPLFEKGLRIIQEEADRIDRRVADLLDLTRTGPTAPDRDSVFDLAEVVRDVVAVASAEPGTARVQVDLPKQLGQVVGDADEVRGALLNLLKNAAEAMAPQGGGTVEVLAEVLADEVVLRIRDQGPGLAPAEPEQAFQAFYTTKNSGTGLGLAIARTAIQASGGTLSLAPREDRSGAVASVRLLRAPAPQRSET